VTSEWSKRTALTTFALEPRRWRVLAAKMVAGGAVALASSALMIVLAFPTTAAVAAGRGGSVGFELEPLTLVGWAASNLVFTLSGVALGALLLNAAAAIVVYFVASIAWSFVGVAGDLGATLASWFDLNATISPLANGELSSESVGPLLASIGAWVGLPFLLGLLRVNRSELR
jgi:ABC-2 type transport system permease protein